MEFTPSGDSVPQSYPYPKYGDDPYYYINPLPVDRPTTGDLLQQTYGQNQEARPAAVVQQSGQTLIYDPVTKTWR